MREPVRMALLGAGLSGRVLHLPALKRIREVDLVAVAEPDVATRSGIGNTHPGVRLYSDVRECLDREDLEAVIVATPNASHLELAQAAFGHGLHVYLEKPMAETLVPARRLLDIWRSSGRAGQIGFNYRWNDLHLEARSLIRQGRIGKPIAVQSIFASARHEPAAWRRERSSGGGTLLDRCSHHLDLLEWHFDSPVQWIECELGSRHSEHDTSALQAGLENGVTAHVLASFDGFDVDRMTFLGEGGGIEVDRYESDFPRLIAPSRKGQRWRRWTRATRELLSRDVLRRKLTRAPEEASYESALREFVSAIRAQRQPEPDLNVGYRSMVVLDAAERAARNGCRTEVPRDADANSSD